MVKPREVVSVDGTVLSGESEVSEAMPTGESLSVAKVHDVKIVAGTLDTTGPFVIRIDSTGDGTRLAHVARLLDRTLAQKPRLAKVTDRYAFAFAFGELLPAVPAFVGRAWYTDA